MAARNPNALIRQRYQQARAIVRRDEDRELTQREFLDVAFGRNPRTDKPYNTRTLRKWLGNERNASKAVEHSVRDTWSFQQHVGIGDHDFAPTLTKPSGASGLDLFTPSGRKRVKTAARERLQERIEQTETAREQRPEKPPEDMTDTDRYLRTTRGLRMRKARAVSKKRAGVIIERRSRTPQRYISEQAA